MGVDTYFAARKYGVVLSSLNNAMSSWTARSASRQLDEVREKIVELGPLSYLKREEASLKRRELGAKITIGSNACSLYEWVARRPGSALSSAATSLRVGGQGLMALATGVRIYGLVDEIDYYHEKGKLHEGTRIGEEAKHLSFAKGLSLLGEVLGVAFLVMQIGSLILGVAASPFLTLFLIPSSLFFILLGAFYPGCCGVKSEVKA